MIHHHHHHHHHYHHHHHHHTCLSDIQQDLESLQWLGNNGRILGCDHVIINTLLLSYHTQFKQIKSPFIMVLIVSVYFS